jgi:hypothetical protein
VRRPA